MQTLPEHMASEFNQQGYLVIPNFISLAACNQLIHEQQKILADVKNKQTSKVIFDTQDRQHAQNQYFFDSARKISVFYEKDAFTTTGDLAVPLERAINKIGHALHDYNKIFRQFSYQAHIKNLLLTLGLIKPKIIQSMYLLKQPKIGNKVDLHQDSTYLFTEPESCIGLWFALEEATVSNGCLWAIPGGHKDSLRERMVREEMQSKVQILDTKPFDLAKAVPLEVAAGSVVVIHGRLPHYSNYNHSARSRHAYSLHAIDAQTDYLRDNWLQDNEERPFVSWPATCYD